MCLRLTKPPDRAADWPDYDWTQRLSPAMFVGRGIALSVANPAVSSGAHTAWIRLVDGVVDDEPVGVLALLAAAGDYASGLSAPPITRWPPPIRYVNADLEIRAIRTSSARQVRVDATTQWAEDGVGITQAEIADDDGVLAMVAQTMILSPTR